MSPLESRLRKFEHDYAYDAETRFRVEARADKLLGLWAAALLNKAGVEARNYANELIQIDVREPGHDCVTRKVSKDLGRRASLDDVEGMRASFVQTAKTQISLGK